MTQTWLLNERDVKPHKTTNCPLKSEVSTFSNIRRVRRRKNEAKKYKKKKNEEAEKLTEALKKERSHLAEDVASRLEAGSRQYLEGLAIEHANVLLDKIRHINCRLIRSSKAQTIILANSNGLIEARLLGRNPCTKS